MGKAVFFAFILSLVLASCRRGESAGAAVAGCVYRDAVGVLSSNWNPHTYQTTDEAYPITAGGLASGLYEFVFNDALHPRARERMPHDAPARRDGGAKLEEDTERAFSSYAVIPSLAASMPRDVTREVRAARPEFGIPASAARGFAYAIDLNPDASWEDGTPINADTYVYSMKALLDPRLLNYRASDFYAGQFCIAGARSYATGDGTLPYDSTVGLYKSGEYQITIVLEKSLSGFSLLYSLSSFPLVYERLYEECLSENGGIWSSTYCTSVETTMSYGPYKMTDYQTDKYMRFERNPEWHGWRDGRHRYVDPVDNVVYDMYQTDVIECRVVAEAATRRLMFLRGELATYGLQADDFATYSSSDFAYFSPDGTIFFLILNGHREAIEQRESARDFDRSTRDLECLTLTSFRQAFALTYDRELFAATISPARSGGYGIIGAAYVYDTESAALYRDTEQAKHVLCEFYSADNVADITGYDPEAARALYTQAFREALAAGYVTDSDGDGVCDQTVEIEYAIAQDSDFMTRTIDYLNDKMAEVTAGTPFAGKIRFRKSAPYGSDWASKIKSGMSDTVLAGWSGSLLNPFALTDLYVNPDYSYDAAWFDSSSVTFTQDIAGERITMDLRSWSDALNGATVKDSEGRERNFGEGHAATSMRLDILSAIEGEILRTYDYIPMLQNASCELLSQQMYYVIEDYNPIMGRGGLAYLRYNYNAREWADFVRECGGELNY